MLTRCLPCNPAHGLHRSLYMGSTQDHLKPTQQELARNLSQAREIRLQAFSVHKPEEFRIVGDTRTTPAHVIRPGTKEPFSRREISWGGIEFDILTPTGQRKVEIRHTGTLSYTLFMEGRGHRAMSWDELPELPLQVVRTWWREMLPKWTDPKALEEWEPWMK